MKKIVSLVLAFVLVAAISVGATLAYLTSTDENINTFTVGNVKIDLTEHDNKGGEFQQNQKLLPGTSSKNAVAKNAVVTVLDGSEDSYVWVEVLVPRELYLDNGGNESANGLHFNQWKQYIVGYDGITSNPNGAECAEKYPEDHQWSVAKYVGDAEVNDHQYAVLRTTHKGIVKANESTCPAISQVYMDWRVHEENGKVMVPSNVQGTEFKEYEGPWQLVLRAYAIQAAGIANVEEAVEVYGNQAAPLK